MAGDGNIIIVRNSIGNDFLVENFYLLNSWVTVRNFIMQFFTFFESTILHLNLTKDSLTVLPNWVLFH